MKNLVILTLLLGPFVGCHQADVTILPNNNANLASFKIGQKRTIQVGNNPARTLSIRFTDVKEGRCSGDQCTTCYGGYAYAYFEVTGEDTTDSLVLSRISCVSVDRVSFDNPIIDRKAIQGLRIGLATISDNQQNKSQYITQLLIEEL